MCHVYQQGPGREGGERRGGGRKRDGTALSQCVRIPSRCAQPLLRAPCTRAHKLVASKHACTQSCTRPHAPAAAALPRRSRCPTPAASPPRADEGRSMRRRALQRAQRRTKRLDQALPPPAAAPPADRTAQAPPYPLWPQPRPPKPVRRPAPARGDTAAAAPRELAVLPLVCPRRASAPRQCRAAAARGPPSPSPPPTTHNTTASRGAYASAQVVNFAYRDTSSRSSITPVFCVPVDKPGMQDVEIPIYRGGHSSNVEIARFVTPCLINMFIQ
eukprot:COSAG02_NODE_8380_length_2591_cov_15.477323_2_plen_273_part_00